MKVLFLTNNENTLTLARWIENQGDEVDVFEEKISVEYLKTMEYEIIVSYNYKHIIKEDVIEYMRGNIVNMHISLLPWNKGASPNFWSFVDNTPKGVTIHQIDKGLDTGDILFQKQVELKAEELTFRQSYTILNEEITELLKKHWNDIKSGNYSLKTQKEKGTYHTTSDLEAIKKKITFEWDDRIIDVINMIKIRGK